MQNLPKFIKAAHLTQFKQPLQIQEIAIPELKTGQVLIKVEAAPINPLDVQIMNGTFNAKLNLPLIVGREGSGIVVQRHESVKTIEIGARVGFSSNFEFGSYSQYSIASINKIIPLPQNLSFEEGASVSINPPTAIAMLEETKLLNSKAIVNTAAASALGRMVFKYFQLNGYDVINIVRKNEQVQLLKQEGAKYVLNSSTPSFLEELKALAESLDAHVFWDAIGGPLTGDIIKQMPNNSTIILYGNLEASNFEVNSIDLRRRWKTIKPFFLFNTNYTFNPFLNKEALEVLQKLLGSIFKTEINQSFNFSDINQAIETQKINPTAGKILIKPNQ